MSSSRFKIQYTVDSIPADKLTTSIYFWQVYFKKGVLFEQVEQIQLETAKSNWDQSWKRNV